MVFPSCVFICVCVCLYGFRKLSSWSRICNSGWAVGGLNLAEIVCFFRYEIPRRSVQPSLRDLRGFWPLSDKRGEEVMLFPAWFVHSKKWVVVAVVVDQTRRVSQVLLQWLPCWQGIDHIWWSNDWSTTVRSYFTFRWDFWVFKPMPIFAVCENLLPAFEDIEAALCQNRDWRRLFHPRAHGMGFACLFQCFQIS